MSTLRFALATLALSLLAGCQTTNDLQVLPQLFDDLRPAPVSSVREDFHAAKTADPELRLGFFRAPWSYDFSAEGSTITNEESLLQALKSELGSWDAPGRRAFREGEWLVVFQDEATMAQIRPWLSGYGNRVVEDSTMVVLEFRVLTAPEEAWIELLGVPRDSSALVTEAQLAAIDRDSRVQTVHAPRLTVIDGQRANIQIVNQRAYVSDFDVYTVDDEAIADPVIQVLQEGLIIEVRPTVGDGIATLDLDATTSELIEMRQAEVEISADQTVEIEIPVVDTRAIDLELVTTPHEWSFLRFGNTDRLLLVRWHPIAR